ncbi:MAG: hypothetical protein J2P45_10080 [Candidatus Dormibacteraeota bacterium]|nr:hypothetical protein [Candidatus Dormibacteraeota bacterium]
MSKFKRVSLVGSEELFRETRPRVVDDDDDTLTEVVERRPRQVPLQQFEFTSEEVELLLEAIQTAKYPERAKGKLPLDRFERYDALRDRLQGRT